MMNGNIEDTLLVIDNQRIYQYYKERLINLALAQFIWEGDVFEGENATCDADFFERRLLFAGKACMCKPLGTDEWLSVGYVNKGDLNVYGYPTRIAGVGFNNANIPTEEWEILYDNKTRLPLWNGIDLNASLLAEIHMTFRANLRAQAHPYVFAGSRYQELSFKNIMMKIFGHAPYIAVKKAEDVDNIKVFNSEVTYNGIQLQDSLDRQWTKALAMLGIAPANVIDKKERLITDEVDMAKEEYIIARNARELNRKQFCEKMKRHGVNISVHMCNGQDVDYDLPRDMVNEELKRVQFEGDSVDKEDVE